MPLGSKLAAPRGSLAPIDLQLKIARSKRKKQQHGDHRKRGS